MELEKENLDIFKNKKYIKFDNHNYFRFKLLYSLLTSSPIEINNIHINDQEIGLKKYELSFLQLICQITNNSHVKINETGVKLIFIPGTITNNNGTNFSFDCDISRGLSYYIEGIFPICLYGKEKLNCNLKGKTNCDMDLSMDCFKSGIDAIISKIVVGDTGNKILIKSRSFEGEGEVELIFPIIRFIQPFDWTNTGKIKKIDGHCFTQNCSQFSTRIIDKFRVYFNKILNTVYIPKNTSNDKLSTPGFSLSAWGITTEGFIYSYDSNVYKGKKLDPEDLSEIVSQKLLEEILMVIFLLRIQVLILTFKVFVLY